MKKLTESQVDMHVPFLWVQAVVKLYLLRKPLVERVLDSRRNLREVPSHVGAGRLVLVSDGRWVVRPWDPQVLHDAVDVVVNGLEVDQEVIIDGAGVAELEERHEVLVVRRQQETGHELEELRKRGVEVSIEVLHGHPVHQPLSVVEIQEVGLQPVWELSSPRDVKRTL